MYAQDQLQSLSSRAPAGSRQPDVLLQALAMSEGAEEDEQCSQALQSMQALLSALPAPMRQSMSDAMAQSMQHGLPSQALGMLGDQCHPSSTPNRRFSHPEAIEVL